MSLSGKKLGQTGEKAGVRFLETQGYTILEQNYRTRHFEIDIIARENDTLCFIEVKTRSTLKKGRPRESVTPAKQKKIIMGTSFYLKSNKIVNQRVRFDVVEIIYTGDVPEITLIRNAFQGE